MTNDLVPGQPMLPPPDFPVSWDSLADAKLYWRLDAHVTAPKAPLSNSFSTAILNGFNLAFAQLGLGIQLRTIVINGYGYSTVIPTNKPPLLVQQAIKLLHEIVPPFARWLKVRQQISISQNQLATMEPILERFESHWGDELLPQIRAKLAFFRTANLAAMSLTELRAHLREVLAEAKNIGKLHALAAFPAMLAMSLFEEFFIEQFPKATSLEALRLLRGFENQTLSGDRTLWRLSRQALTMPTVVEILQNKPAANVLTELTETVEGRTFIEHLNSYLEIYGRRLNTFGQLTEPSWIEQPETVIACLQTYLLASENGHPEAVHAQLTAERQQAVIEAQRLLAHCSPAVRTRFSSLLSAAQCAAGIKEDNHWLIQAVHYELRRLALELGRRLTATGALTTVDDIFYLKADEIMTERLSGPTQIKERRAARILFSQITPPAQLGTIPSSPPLDTPFLRAIQKADVARFDSHPGTDVEVRGQAASGGVRQGRARLVHSLADAGTLQPGEVLVTRATTPPWTPLFGIAAAVVTDTGGILSHCAVVAREYGIPAVVGTGRATQIFRNGQLLEVDGTNGIVRVAT